MKKFLAVLLVGMLVLTGCGKKDEKPAESKGGDVKIGTSVIPTSKAVEAKDGKDAGFQTDVTYAMVVLEGDKIVAVHIDAAQNVQNYKADGTVVPFEAKVSKKELGADYKMKEYGKAVAEWNEQIESLEKWMTGKTVAEVTGMKLNEGKPAESDLTSSVTISVSGYIKAVEEAAKAAVDVKGVAKTAIVSETYAGQEGLELNTMVTSVALDKDGKIVYSFTDEAKMTAKLEGSEIKIDETNKTKRQLGADYGMDWKGQVEAFNTWTVGKTPADVQKADSASDLTSKVTVKGSMNGFKSGIDKAAKAAK